MGASQKKGLILCFLKEAGGKGLYGLELVAQSDGMLSRGTVYPTLHRMKVQGLVESTAEPAKKGQRGPARVKYTLTPDGEEALASWLAYEEVKARRFSNLKNFFQTSPTQPESSGNSDDG